MLISVSNLFVFLGVGLNIFPLFQGCSIRSVHELIHRMNVWVAFYFRPPPPIPLRGQGAWEVPCMWVCTLGKPRITSSQSTSVSRGFMETGHHRQKTGSTCYLWAALRKIWLLTYVQRVFSLSSTHEIQRWKPYLIIALVDFHSAERYSIDLGKGCGYISMVIGGGSPILVPFNPLLPN